MLIRPEQLLAEEKLLPGDRDLLPYFRVIYSGVTFYEAYQTIQSGTLRDVHRISREMSPNVPDWEVTETVIPKFPLTVSYLRENHDLFCFQKWSRKPQQEKSSWWDKLLNWISGLSFPRGDWEWAKAYLHVRLLDVVTLTKQNIPMDEAFLLTFTKLAHVMEDTYFSNTNNANRLAFSDWGNFEMDLRVLEVTNHFCDLVHGLLTAPLSPEQAILELQKRSGIEYDPDVVEALVDCQEDVFSEELSQRGPEKFFQSYRTSPLFKNVFIRTLINAERKHYASLGQPSPFLKLIREYIMLRKKGVWTPEEYRLMQEEAFVKYLVNLYLPEGSRFKAEYRNVVPFLQHLYGRKPKESPFPADVMEIYEILHDWCRRVHGHNGFSPRSREQALREIQALEGNPYSFKLVQTFLDVVKKEGENFDYCFHDYHG